MFFLTKPTVNDKLDTTSNHATGSHLLFSTCQNNSAALIIISWRDHMMMLLSNYIAYHMIWSLFNKKSLLTLGDYYMDVLVNQRVRLTVRPTTTGARCLQPCKQGASWRRGAPYVYIRTTFRVGWRPVACPFCTSKWVMLVLHWIIGTNRKPF